MTKRILHLATAALAVSASFAWAADVPPSVQRGLYEDGHWSVAGVAFADGNRDCVLANTQRMSSGETAFVLNEFGSGVSTIMFRDTTITWDASGGSVTFWVDDNPSFTALTRTDATRNLLIVPLANTSGSVMTTFLHQLTSGHELHLVTEVKTETFDLYGSSPAFDAFGHCIAAMSSDGG